MIGVYAYAVLTTGAVSRVVILSRDDVMEAKAKSDGANSDYSPWKTNERAMWWKTAARRLEPWVPTSAEYRREQLRAAVEADNLRTVRFNPDSSAPIVDATTGQILDAELVDEPLPPDQP
jgi:recombination protein RecT